VTLVTAIRLSGLALSFALSVTLGRLLEPSGFGRYTYLLTWIYVFGMIGASGLDRLLVRETSFYVSSSSWRELRGLLTLSSAVTFVGAFVVASIVVFVPAHLFFWGNDERIMLLVTIGLVLAYPFYLVQLAALSGFGRIGESQFIQNVLPPVIMLSVILAYASSSQLTLPDILFLHLIAIIAAIGILFLRNLRALPQAVLSVSPVFENSRWLASAGRMLLLGGLSLAGQKIDFLLLGFLSNSEELGLYAVAVRGASLISLPLSMVVITIAPVIARMHAEGSIKHAKSQIINQLRFALLAGAVIALGLNICSNWFLGFFGKGFGGASTALAILSVGQLINVAAGPVACMLTMTRQERSAVIGIGIGTLITGLSGLLLIAPFGSNGAATASSLGIITWNLFLVWSVHRTLGIGPLLIGTTGKMSVSQ
jgi:O-antigen/teichoic acid export membrane protein